MSYRRLIRVLGWGVVLAAFSSPAPAQEAPPIIAEVGGRQITQAELQQKERGKLLQARYQYYLAERKVLDQIIDEELLEAEARRERLTVQELLDRHVNSQVKDPTEDQLEVYYEGVDTSEPYSAIRAQIIQHIHRLRLAKVRTAYLQSLRDTLGVTVDLQPPTADVPRGDAPLRGSPDAPVVMIEFADYQCPYCREINPEITKLEKEFSGRLALAYKDFPLPMHAHAEKAAEAARCAREQGKFWEFHDALFEKGAELDVSQLKAYAGALKLDQTRFDKCLDSGEQSAAVQQDLTQGKALGLSGTPSFFINGHFISGTVDYSTLRSIVEKQLAVLPAPPASPRAANR